MPRLSANFLIGPGLTTTSATQYDSVDLAYTMVEATSGHCLRTFSTLDRATYSPCCSFTRSFLRSTMSSWPRSVKAPMSPVWKKRTPSMTENSVAFFFSSSGSAM